MENLKKTYKIKEEVVKKLTIYLKKNELQYNKGTEKDVQK